MRSTGNTVWTGAVVTLEDEWQLPRLSNLVYDGTMFIYGDNGPRGPEAGEEWSICRHMSTMW